MSESTPDPPRHYRFADLTLDTGRRQVRRGAEVVALSKRTFGLLLALVEAAPDVVSHDRLADQVWGPRRIVTPENLSQSILRLRQALGDDAANPRYIESLRGQGYRLIPAVARLPGRLETDVQTAHTSPRRAGPWWRASHVAAVGLSVTAALLALTVTYLVVDKYALDGSTGDRAELTADAAPVRNPTLAGWRGGDLPRIAVLPCDNLSPDPDDAYFAAGIHEEILSRLARLRSLSVISRNSVMPYAEKRPPTSQIAEALGVQAVLECSVRYAGDNILVTAQLIDPETNVHVWSQTYPGDLTDLSTVFAMQADIATSIANVLNAEFSWADQRQLAQAPTKSHEAYVLYLKALEAYGADFGNSATIIGYLDQALEADPEFGLAYAFRGFARFFGFLDVAATDSDADIGREIELARQDANRALEINAAIGFAYIVLAIVHDYKGDAATADAEVARALELSPTDWTVLMYSANFHLRHYRRAEALALVRRVRGLNPLHPYLPGYFLYAGDVDGAYETARRQAELNPTSGGQHAVLGLLSAIRGDDAAAERELRLAERLGVADHPSPMWTALVYGYGRIGLGADARRVFGLRADVADTHPAARVMAYLGIGDVDQAFESASILTRMSAQLPTGLQRALIAYNFLADPALETPGFLELRDELRHN